MVLCGLSGSGLLCYTLDTLIGWSVLISKIVCHAMVNDNDDQHLDISEHLLLGTTSHVRKTPS